MLYIVYKELSDGVKEQLMITNDREIAGKCRDFHALMGVEDVKIEEAVR